VYKFNGRVLSKLFASVETFKYMKPCVSPDTGLLEPRRAFDKFASKSAKAFKGVSGRWSVRLSIEPALSVQPLQVVGGDVMHGVGNAVLRLLLPGFIL
jgi:hypothetical protein